MFIATPAPPPAHTHPTQARSDGRMQRLLFPWLLSPGRGQGHTGSSPAKMGQYLTLASHLSSSCSPSHQPASPTCLPLPARPEPSSLCLPASLPQASPLLPLFLTTGITPPTAAWTVSGSWPCGREYMQLPAASVWEPWPWGRWMAAETFPKPRLGHLNSCHDSRLVPLPAPLLYRCCLVLSLALNALSDVGGHSCGAPQCCGN